VPQILLLLVTYPIVISLLAGVTAVVWAVLPVPKVPLRYNLRNLQLRWKTTLVTALAFTLVVSLLTVMLAFVRAMYRLTEESGVPGNVLILSDGATDEAFSNLPGNVSVESLPADIQAGIQKDENNDYLAVKEVYVIVNHVIPGASKGQRQRRFLQMRGIDNPDLAAKVHKITLQPNGTWFSGSAVRAIGKDDTAYEVVLGDGVARTFGQDRGQKSIKVGEVLEIGPRKWIVVGIMEPSGSSFGNEIWARDQHVAENYGRQNSYSSFVVRTKDEETAKLATKLVKDYRAEKSLAAYTEKEYYDRLSQTNLQFLVAFMFIAFFMAVGGVFGIMNTMFAAISQRTKDIGVMRLLGYSRWQILMSFLMESLVIALIGGALGCLAGYLLANGTTASSIISAGAGGGGKSVVLKLIVDPLLIGVGLLFALIMGAVGGLIPSLSAMRLKPLESLR
jgi:ABC-type antimicrobial peptide transport system permease subunit